MAGTYKIPASCSSPAVLQTAPHTMVEYSPKKLGRVFGGLVLLAFLLYGFGIGRLGHTSGTLLILLNSVAVIGAGFAGLRALPGSKSREGMTYFLGRIVEGTLLGLGAVLVQLGAGKQMNETMYLWSMAVLGGVSVPFCRALWTERLLPVWLALWGVIGYALFSAGAVLSILKLYPLKTLAVAPGGLFELVAGVYLLVLGFGNSVVGSGAEAELPLLQREVPMPPTGELPAAT